MEPYRNRGDATCSATDAHLAEGTMSSLVFSSRQTATASGFAGALEAL
jgi:hypothetical protein